jgi:hypothetical protein
MPVPQNRGDDIVPVGKNVGADLDALVDRSLDRKAAAVNFGSDALDDDASRQVGSRE